jgi:hypothetical protein
MLCPGMARPVTKIGRMGDWLVKQFTIFWGASFQNWMVVAVAIILIAIILAWATRR